jgi:hypothetical protein
MILRRSKAVSVSESPKDGKADSDTRLELAYAAGQARLSGQNATLANLRSRANNLLATSALLSSLATGIGLLNTDPRREQYFPRAAPGCYYS